MHHTIKLSTDWSMRPRDDAPPVIILYPFWKEQRGREDAFSDKSEFRDVDRFAGIVREWRTRFLFVDDPSHADWVCLPSDWKHYQRARKTDLGHSFLKSMAREGYRTVVQYYADDPTPLNLSDIDPPPLVMRTSFFASKRLPYEYAMPGFIGDPVGVYGVGGHVIRDQQERPTIGFCGQTSTQILSDGALLSALASHDASDAQVYACRNTILDRLECSASVHTRFIRRQGYCAGVSHANDFAGLRHVRREYFTNMFNSDYVLCIRGIGNYSYRFYEALMCARVPVLVDTDTPLPLPDSIAWRDQCVIVVPTEVQEIGDIVAEHYKALKGKAFARLQLKNRAIARNMLTPETYFSIMLRTHYREKSL